MGKYILPINIQVNFSFNGTKKSVAESSPLEADCND